MINNMGVDRFDLFFVYIHVDYIPQSGIEFNIILLQDPDLDKSDQKTLGPETLGILR